MPRDGTDAGVDNLSAPAGPSEETAIHPKPTFRVLLALIALLALVAGACADSGADDEGGDDSSDDTEETTDDGGDGEEAADGEGLAQFDLGGQEITVGSKDFTEQLVLGQIYLQALEAAGASVSDQTNTGGTSVARTALTSGEIDVYAEYNGTGWTVHLGREDPSFDSEELTEGVREGDLEENEIVWIGRAPFNNTYGFAAGPDFVAENGELDLQGMADYLAENPDATVCMESEYPSRPDGLVLFEDATGYEVTQDQTEILETNLIYTETASGACTFGEIFTTDGRIPALELDIIDDPGVHILYNISATMRQEVYEENPEAFDAIFEMIHAPLDNETMAELNRRVSVEGEEPAAVAQDYLETQGLL